MTSAYGENQDIKRQGAKQHRERGEVLPALAVEDFDDHCSWAGEKVLKREPDAAILAEESRQKVFDDETHREASRFGTLTTLGTKIPLKLGAAVEAFCGFGLVLGLYFVLHGDLDLMGTKVINYCQYYK